MTSKIQIIEWVSIDQANQVWNGVKTLYLISRGSRSLAKWSNKYEHWRLMINMIKRIAQQVSTVFEDILIKDNIWKPRIVQDKGEDIFRKHLECW